MAFLSAFDVIGPAMIGPSSSHTAGAAVLARLARKMLPGTLASVHFTLYGSFAKTYAGHGTDRALLGGMLGFAPDDERIRDSFRLAEEQGVAFSFSVDTDASDLHPNTAEIRMINAEGHEMTVRGESLGGGRVRISRINLVDVDFTGEYATLIVIHRDRPGLVAHIASCLSRADVNIAFMRLYREARGSTAYSVVESDGHLPETVTEALYENENVFDVMILQS